MQIFNPHDRAFKNAMKDIKVAKEFFENYLSENVLKLVDLSTLKHNDNTYIDPKLRQYQSDILFEVMIKNRPGFLYILLENQSTAEQLMPFRSWQYRIGIWNDFIKAQATKPNMLPLIVPIVFYNGPKPYDKPRDLRKIIEADPELIEELLFKDFCLIDTNDLADESLKQQMWSGLVAFAFKHAFDRDFKKSFSEFIERSRILLASQGTEASDLVLTLLNYQANVGKLKSLDDESLDILQEQLTLPKGGDLMGTLADYLRREGMAIGLKEGQQEGLQRGRQEGRQEGLQRGRQEGESLLLLRLVQRKFGLIPSYYRKKIETADDHTLLTWGERILEANSIEDIFEEKIFA